MPHGHGEQCHRRLTVRIATDHPSGEPASRNPVVSSMECLYCGRDLDTISPDELPAGSRIAFDPALGRLWQVCAGCERWNAVPFERRWEVLEACERRAAEADVLLKTDALSLMQAGRVQLVRVGRPPRAELAVWRYSELLDRFRRGRRVFSRILSLPDRPVGGNIGRDYHGGVVTVPDAWIGSPFIEHGSLLTLLFSSIPLAPDCPSCGRPLMLEPARLGDVRLTASGGVVHVTTACALCRTTVDVPVSDARPTLRTALAVVSRGYRGVGRVRRAVEPIDRRGTAHGFVARIARREASIGSLPPRLRLALWLALDETAEAELLEAEWRNAEGIAAISDGELTSVPGFAEFKRRIVGNTTEQG